MYDNVEDFPIDLEVPDWMTEVLDKNPDYNGWCPWGDYMAGRNRGLETSQTFLTWAEFSKDLNNLNECVNFYFCVKDADDYGDDVPVELWVNLWRIFPRKGASCGIEVRLVQEDLPDVYKWLRRAAERNAQRFAKV